MDDVEILSEPLRKVKVVGQWNVRNHMSAETNKNIYRNWTKGDQRHHPNQDQQGQFFDQGHQDDYMVESDISALLLTTDRKGTG